jgi:hypothetical protein
VVLEKDGEDQLDRSLLRFKEQQAAGRFDDRTDAISRNVGNWLPINAGLISVSQGQGGCP